MNKESKRCNALGIQHKMFCIEELGHKGYHTYGPVEDTNSETVKDLDEIIRLLIDCCPEGFINVKQPDPRCCVFHRAATTLVEIRNAFAEIPDES